jgi:hypothetical protein
MPVLIDISSPDSWVTASIYPRPFCDGVNLYDGNLSSTFHPSNKVAELDYVWIRAAGNITRDTIRFGGLPVPDQAFVVANKLGGGGGPFDQCPMAGVFGFAPYSTDSILEMPSPFLSMVQQGRLEKELFALRLRKPTELSFGRINPALYQGQFTEVPLTNKTTETFSGGWQTEATYMELHGEGGFVANLDGIPTTFSTRLFPMMVPERIHRRLVEGLGLQDIEWFPPSLPCEFRKDMPNITFNLAGKNLTLTPFDYMMPFNIPSVDERCICNIMPIAQYGKSSANEIILGWTFLRSFYSVFDRGVDTISCKYAPWASVRLGCLTSADTFCFSRKIILTIFAPERLRRLILEPEYATTIALIFSEGPLDLPSRQYRFD